MSKKKLSEERDRQNEILDRADELLKEKNALDEKTRADLCDILARTMAGLDSVYAEWEELRHEQNSLKPHYVEKFERVVEINNRINRLREKELELDLQLWRKCLYIAERHSVRARVLLKEHRKLIGESFDIGKKAVLKQRIREGGVRDEGRHS